MGYGDLASMPQSPPSLLSLRLAGFAAPALPSRPAYVPVPVYGDIGVPDTMTNDLRQLRSRVDELERQLQAESEARKAIEQKYEQRDKPHPPSISRHEEYVDLEEQRRRRQERQEERREDLTTEACIQKAMGRSRAEAQQALDKVTPYIKENFMR